MNHVHMIRTISQGPTGYGIMYQLFCIIGQPNIVQKRDTYCSRAVYPRDRTAPAASWLAASELVVSGLVVSGLVTSGLVESSSASGVRTPQQHEGPRGQQGQR